MVLHRVALMTERASKKLPKTTDSMVPPSATQAKDQLILFQVMKMVAAVDGKFDDAETALVRGYLITLPDFRNAVFETLNQRSLELSKKYGGLLESMEAVTELSTEARRRKAFILALDVAHASTGVNPVESTLLSSLQKLLYLDPTFASHAREVIAQKYAL